MTMSYYHPPDPHKLTKAQDLARNILHLQAQEMYLSDPDDPPGEEPHWLTDPDLDHVQEALRLHKQDLLRLLAPDEYRHWDRVINGEDPTE